MSKKIKYFLTMSFFMLSGCSSFKEAVGLSKENPEKYKLEHSSKTIDLSIPPILYKMPTQSKK